MSSPARYVPGGHGPLRSLGQDRTRSLDASCIASSQRRGRSTRTHLRTTHHKTYSLTRSEQSRLSPGIYIYPLALFSCIPRPQKCTNPSCQHRVGAKQRCPKPHRRVDTAAPHSSVSVMLFATDGPFLCGMPVRAAHALANITTRPVSVSTMLLLPGHGWRPSPSSPLAMLPALLLLCWGGSCRCQWKLTTRATTLTCDCDMDGWVCIALLVAAKDQPEASHTLFDNVRVSYAPAHALDPYSRTRMRLLMLTLTPALSPSMSLWACAASIADSLL